MTDELSAPVDANDAGENSAATENKALKVPLEAFKAYLERMRPGRKCTFCADGTYQVAPSPAGGTAGVVATPVPNVAKIGVWFFVATCDVCGDTRIFHAGRTFAAMTSDQ